MPWANINKSTTPTFLNILRHGNPTVLADIANYTFTDVAFPDGTQLKDVTFDELLAQVWTNISKSSTPTWTDTTRNQ